MELNEISRILSPYRARIDALDGQIVSLLAARFEIIREVAQIKAEKGIPSVLNDRVDAVLDRTAGIGAGQGLDPSLIRAVYGLLIEHAHDIENRAKMDFGSPGRKHGV